MKAKAVKGAKRAEGGKVTEYNAKGSPAMAAADDKTPGFKKGGKKAKGGAVSVEVAKKASGGEVAAPKTKLKSGGTVMGTKSATRLDKRARGGRMAGGSPYSSAKSDANPATSTTSNSGHEGERPSSSN